MSIVYYQPWSVFDGFKPGISRLVNARRGAPSDASAWQPAVDIVEEAERFVVRVDVPGVDPQSIDVATDEGVLRIRGSRSPATEEAADVSYRRRERARGEFQRSFSLPETAEVSKISASHKHGVLEILVPKRPEVTPRKIEVTH